MLLVDQPCKAETSIDLEQLRIFFFFLNLWILECFETVEHVV